MKLQDVRHPRFFVRFFFKSSDEYLEQVVHVDLLDASRRENLGVHKRTTLSVLLRLKTEKSPKL